jgi:multidrug efflux pump subunit AcrA (membrane-fusion protein)
MLDTTWPRWRGRGSRLIGAGMMLLLALTPLLSCSQPPTRPAETTPVVAEQPTTSPTAEMVAERAAGPLSYAGDIKAKAQVALTSKGMGRIEELKVDVGGAVRAGEVIGRLDRATLEAQLKQSEAALAMATAKLAQMEAGSRAELIAQARANLASAQERLDQSKEGGRGEAVAQAEAGLKAAEARLQQLKNGPTEEQRRAALQAVEGAKVALHGANVKKDGDCNKAYPEYLCKAAQAAAIAAAHNVDAAQAQYDALVAAPTPELLAQAQSAVDQARAALEMAKRPATEHDIAQAQNAVQVAAQALKIVESPFTKSDFDVAQAGVAQAQAAVDLVKVQLADMDIVAPVDGVIAEKHLSVGALAAPQTPILSIISSEVEVAISVEEARAGQVRVGQVATLTVAAYPGETFAGTVTTIAPAIDPKSRTFAVKVSPKDDAGKLKAGMFAKVTLGAP